MRKTPDDIKKGLECCYSPVEPIMRCEQCPYIGSVVCHMRFHKDAIALIQQLEAKVTKWISVEERLPEDDVDVIVYAVSNNGGCAIAITFHTHTLYGFNIEGWMPPWQYFSRNYTITHWMPLPKPPKEVEK